MPVAAERGRKGGFRILRGVSYAVPARAAVPVGVVGVGHAVAVGVEVDVRRQLVALAAVRRLVRVAAVRTAHAGGGVGERAGGGGGIAGVQRHAVAVEVPAHGVQLRVAADLDEPVVVRVVVRAGLLVVGDRHAHRARGDGARRVAAAGSLVGDQRQLVVGVRVVVHRRDGDRLRGGPVGGGEGERARAAADGGVVAGDGDRDVAGGRTLQRDGVAAGAAALGERDGLRRDVDPARRINRLRAGGERRGVFGAGGVDGDGDGGGGVEVRAVVVQAQGGDGFGAVEADAVDGEAGDGGGEGEVGGVRSARVSGAGERDRDRRLAQVALVQRGGTAGGDGRGLREGGNAGEQRRQRKETDSRNRRQHCHTGRGVSPKFGGGGYTKIAAAQDATGSWSSSTTPSKSPLAVRLSPFTLLRFYAFTLYALRPTTPRALRPLRRSERAIRM